MRIMIGGSRKSNPVANRLASKLTLDILTAEHTILVGCAHGIDEQVLRTCLKMPERVEVFAVGGADGDYFPAGRMHNTLIQAVHEGVRVHWFAGGPAPQVPITARLAMRSRAAVNEAAKTYFVLTTPDSRGSIGAATHAAQNGKPVTFLITFKLKLLKPLHTYRGGHWHITNEYEKSAELVWVPTPD